MEIITINQRLALGRIDDDTMFPHVQRLKQLPFRFEHHFGLDNLPLQPGILMIRGARQYGKSTWLEGQVLETIKTYGPGSAFYLNGDFIATREQLAEEIQTLAVSFTKDITIRRIFIDEITAISDWETVLKRLVDNGTLREILVVTTGSKATDLRRGAERLPGRKGTLEQTNYLFTPISYKSFHASCYDVLKEETLNAYILSGGSPIACSELARHRSIPEYVIQLVRDWIEGEITKSGRHRSALINTLRVVNRFGGTPVGQAKLAREASLANNTVAQGYIEVLNDLGCVIPAYPFDLQKNIQMLRKPCKYHFMNLLVATTYHPSQPRTPADFLRLTEHEQGTWYEWCVAQELQRRAALRGNVLLEPMSFYQTANHEIDFYDASSRFIEVKRGASGPLEFAWFAKQHDKHKLTVINCNRFETNTLRGITLEDFLLEQD